MEQVVAHVAIDPDDGGGVRAQEFEVLEHKDEIGGYHVLVHFVGFAFMVAPRIDPMAAPRASRGRP